jgi:hypothetical protein
VALKAAVQKVPLRRRTARTAAFKFPDGIVAFNFSLLQDDS